MHSNLYNKETLQIAPYVLQTKFQGRYAEVRTRFGLDNVRTENKRLAIEHYLVFLVFASLYNL